MKLITFYHFTKLPDYRQWQVRLNTRLRQTAAPLSGTVLLAPEGINLALCGEAADLAAVCDLFRLDKAGRFTDLEVNEFRVSRPAFKRLKIKCRQEIINFRNNEYEPDSPAAQDLEPAAWNELIKAPDTYLLDARNSFEYDLGSFPQAINPQVERFSQLAKYVRENRQELAAKKVALYCTGGIRCEKLGRYMQQHSIKQVYQLKGGILRYLHKIPQAENLWQGDCFVFDERICVTKQDV